MNQVIQFLIGLALFFLVWYFLRSVAKTFSKINTLEARQNEILDALDEIKNQLKELNKNNSEK